MIRVLLAVDEPLARAGLRHLLGAAEDIVVVDEVDDRENAIPAVARWCPDVVVLGVRGPGPGETGVVRRIRAGADPDSGPQVILLMTRDTGEKLLTAAGSGAVGVVLQDTGIGGLVAAVRSVAGGQGWLDPAVVRGVLAALPSVAPGRRAVTPRLSGLTPRELEVLVRLAEGLSNQELAARLVISEATVKNHVSRVLAKLGLRDRAQAVALAHRSGLVPSHPL